MASPLWLLRVLPDQDGTRWNVVQPRTGRWLGQAPTQELAVEQALERLRAGGTVEVVVDGFTLERTSVLPEPVPRRATLPVIAIALAVGIGAAVAAGLLLDSGVVAVVVVAVNAANAVLLVQRLRAARRISVARPDPALVDLPAARPGDPRLTNRPAADT